MRKEEIEVKKASGKEVSHCKGSIDLILTDFRPEKKLQIGERGLIEVSLRLSKDASPYGECRPVAVAKSLKIDCDDTPKGRVLVEVQEPMISITARKGGAVGIYITATDQCECWQSGSPMCQHTVNVSKGIQIEVVEPV